MRTIVFALLLVASCGKSDNKGGGSAASSSGGKKTVYSCFIQVGAKAETYSSDNHSGDDEKKVSDEAWAAVCAKLPAADQPNCHDSSKWSAGESGGSVASGGKTSYSKTITLTKKSDNFESNAKSEVSSDEACKTATAEACKKAGGEGDCIASGKFELKGHGTGTETSGGM
jgi:hypothetical protein